MSIFDKIKHGVEHAANKAKHTAEHVGHEVKHTADKAGDAVNDAAKKVGDKVASLDPKHIADEVKDEILHTLNEVKDDALKAIKSAEHEAEKGISDLAKKAKDEIEKDLKDFEGKLESKTGKEVLGYLVDVVRAISPSDISVQLGPISMDIGNVEQKIEKLVHYSQHPPVHRKYWIQFIKDIEPDSLSITASVGLGLLIQSDDLKVDVSATWVGSDILDNIDDILEKAGIPEK